MDGSIIAFMDPVGVTSTPRHGRHAPYDTVTMADTTDTITSVSSPTSTENDAVILKDTKSFETSRKALYESFIMTNDVSVINSPQFSSSNNSNVNREEPEGGLFSCIVCDALFRNYDKFKTHQKSHELSHTGEKPYECEGGLFSCIVCDAMFRNFEKFKTHQNTHELSHPGEKLYECTKCLKTFSSVNILRDHIQNSSECQFKCKSCHKTFYTSEDLEIHERKHTGEKLIPSSVGLKKQKITHTGEKPFPSKTHTKEQPYSQTHTGDKPAHTGEKPCHTAKKKSAPERSKMCSYCGKKYATNQALQHHIILIHEQEKAKYKCPVDGCKRVFVSITHYDSHRKSHIHDGDYICVVCGAKFLHNKNLKEHVKVQHEKQKKACTVCHKGISPSNMSKHMKIHTDYPVERCVYCGKRATKMKRHLLICKAKNKNPDN